MRELSGGFTAPLLAVGGILLLGALMMLALGRQIRRDTIAVAVPA